MPDRDNESLQPFIEEETSWDERSSRSSAKSWADGFPFNISGRRRAVSLPDAQSRSHSTVPHIFQRRRNILIVLAISFFAIVPFLLHASRKPAPPAPPPPPPSPPNVAPFWCSTWDTATPIPQAWWSDIYGHYQHWARYDRNAAPKIVPEQRPAQGDEESENHSLVRSLQGKESELAEEKVEKRASKTKWNKPKGIKVIGLIFFGRPHVIDVLDCYLYENMVHQGGYLDEVHFIEHTRSQADIDWLHNLVNATEGYKSFNLGAHCRDDPDRDDCRYERIWERFATDDDTIYIKIDDDMVYMHEDTIPRLVHARIDNAQPYAISANLINSPITAWMHYHLGAIRPYLPEPAPVPRKQGMKPTWRASELPTHPHDAQYQNLALGPIHNNDLWNSAVPDEEAFNHAFEEIPFPGHRWLPLTQNTTSLLYTPMSRLGVDPWFMGVHHWSTAAQQHYSLLQNIEESQLHRYHMASTPPLGVGLYNTQYIRYNLNFLAIWGRDVVLGAGLDPVTKSLPPSSKGYNLLDDEKNMTADIPRTLGRPFMIDVQALASHLHFGPQTPQVQMTDLLDRYRAYANEKVCPKDRQKKVPGQPDGLGVPLGSGAPGWWQCPWIGEREEEEEGEGKELD